MFYLFFQKIFIRINSFKPYLLTGPKPDLTLDSKDISVIGNKIILNIKNNGEIFVSSFKIKLYDIKDGEYLNEKEFSLNEGIYAVFSQKYTLNWTLEGDSIGILLDSNNQIDETNELNNFVLSKTFKPETYSLYLETKNPIFEVAVSEYLTQTLGPEYRVNSNSSDYEIILKKIPVQTNLIDYFTELGVGYLNSLPTKLELKKPYEAIILTKPNEIFIISTSEEGLIVGVKDLIKNFENYRYLNNFMHSDAKNLDGIKIYDYLVLKGKTYSAYRNVLNDNIYEEVDGTIPVNSPEGIINYRYRHLIPQKSELLRQYVDKDDYPVVMAGGIYSDINEWQNFAEVLAKEGFSPYLIELTGGPDAEAKEAYNYPYDFLHNSVLPNYINFILSDSSSEKIKYIGHSNGCRVGLSYFNNTQDLVETFVGLGCPTTLNDLTGATGDILKIDVDSGKYIGDLAIQELEEEGKKHISRQEYTHKLKSFKYDILMFLFEITYTKTKISLELQKFYNDLYIEQNTQFEVNDFSRKYLLFAGNSTYCSAGKCLEHFSDDGVVPISDMKNLSIDLNTELILRQDLNHGTLVKDNGVLYTILWGLK